jgi:hypothetical protein
MLCPTHIGSFGPEGDILPSPRKQCYSLEARCWPLARIKGPSRLWCDDGIIIAIIDLGELT